MDVQTAISYLRSLGAIRERSRIIYDLALQNQLPEWRLQLDNLAAVTALVAKMIKEQYPDLPVPLHSRWRHFETTKIENSWGNIDKTERAKRRIDLITVSCLLDAGSGNRWSYVDDSGVVSSRSEGLAQATLQMFEHGLFSRDSRDPHRVDAEALLKLTEAELSQGLQVRKDNPIVGLSGRLECLHRLGNALLCRPQFQQGKSYRPGHLVDTLRENGFHGEVAELWSLLVDGLGSVWPKTRTQLGGVNLGDVWAHPCLEKTSPGSDLIPLHKLSQWLALSWLEPLQDLGFIFHDLNDFCGLAEYRNGGLFIDSNVLQPTDTSLLKKEHPVGSPLVVGWRALTIVLIDELAKQLRKTLNLPDEKLTIPQVLQGGTWIAGRKIAMELRSDGSPPLRVISDGTVF